MNIQIVNLVVNLQDTNKEENQSKISMCINATLKVDKVLKLTEKYIDNNGVMRLCVDVWGKWIGNYSLLKNMNIFYDTFRMPTELINVNTPTPPITPA